MAGASRTASTTFEHDPLDLTTQEIRLIRILPKTNNTQILRCELKHFNINEKCPIFRALSYTWGRPQFSQMIILNGKPFEIWENLFSFLEVIQELPERTDLIWIDQLCIDQTNVLERNHQVQVMGQIYAEAYEVISWIGVADPDTETFYERVERNKCDITTNKEDLRLLHHFFQRDYWRRLWIVQEIMLAREVVVLCGSMKFRWESLRRLVMEPSTSWPLPVHPLFLQKYPHQPNVGNSFAILITFTSNSCADSRDKVYGLQGMTRTEDRLIIDYNKSAEEVFCDAMVVLLCAPGTGWQFAWPLASNMRLTAIQSSSCCKKLTDYAKQIGTQSERIRRTQEGRSQCRSEDGSTWKLEIMQILEDGKKELRGSKAKSSTEVTTSETNKVADGVLANPMKFWTKAYRKLQRAAGKEALAFVESMEKGKASTTVH